MIAHFYEQYTTFFEKNTKLQEKTKTSLVLGYF